MLGLDTIISEAGISLPFASPQAMEPPIFPAPMIATGADIVILAVKPWLIRGVLREMKLRSKQILVSVAAGISFEQLAHDVVEPEMPMFRIVPNTAISELQSMSQ